MNIQKVILLLASTVMLTACGVTEEQKANVANVAANVATLLVAYETNSVKEVKDTADWQNGMLIAVRDIVTKEYPVNIQGEIHISDDFLNDAVWYFDNDNRKVVLVVRKEDSQKWKNLRKELEERLGDKVQIKKATVDHAKMEDLADHDVWDYLKANGAKGISVAFNPKDELIVVEDDDMSKELQDKLEDKFGKIFKFVKSEGKRVYSVARLPVPTISTPTAAVTSEIAINPETEYQNQQR